MLHPGHFIGGHTQHQINAKTRPRMFGQVSPQQLAHGALRAHVRGVVRYLPVQRLVHDIADAGGAVVVKKIVFVRAVLGEGVVFEQVKKALFLKRGEVELLLLHAPAFHHIAAFKGFKTLHIQDVQQFASAKIEVKIGLVKVERAVIIDTIYILRGVKNPQCAVAKRAVQFAAGRHGHQADDGIGREGAGKLRLNAHGPGRQYQNQCTSVSFYHGVVVKKL